MPNTTFPTALDVWSSPNFDETAIAALETKVGINNSPNSTSLDYLIHNHEHSGTDGSSKIANLSAQAVGAEGPLMTLTSLLAAIVYQVSSAPAGPTVLIQPQSLTAVAQVLKQPSGTPTADMTQWQTHSGSVMAGLTATGGFYSTGAFVLNKGIGGLPYVSTQPSPGEVDFVNGALLRGYSGSATGAGGTGEQFHLDASQGFLKLGGVSGIPSLVLNAWNTLRTSSMQMIGKDNADSGMTMFSKTVDADGQSFAARSLTMQGRLAQTASGTWISPDTFMQFGFPTYDGNFTYTKAVGISVVPNTAPTLTAGAVTLTGNVTVSGPLTQNSNPIYGSSVATATSASAGSASALPATPVGYLNITLAGITRKIPYYAI